MPTTNDRRVLLDGLTFAEAPRWYAGRLWFADMLGRNVTAVDLDGNAEVIAAFDDETSGLGFMPDGSLLVVLRTSKQIVRVDGSAVSVHCDLSGISSPTLNDMVVDAVGRAYVGAFVSRPHPGTDDRGEALILVDEAGTVRGVTQHLINPNGVVVTPSGDELIIAETRLQQLTGFRVMPDGTLEDRHIFADMGEATPDGICLDAEGAIWAGTLNGEAFMRVARGGEVLDTIGSPGSWAVACALGGPANNTLFLLTVTTKPETMRQPGGCTSRIETVTVPVPGVAS